MAIFGSLGKMLGLDSPAGRGFIEGFAGTTAKLVKEDMDRTDERIDRIADYKIKKQAEENERVQKETRENLEKIKAIGGKVGGVNGAEWLIRTYGIEEAVKKADQFEVMRGYGTNPEFLLSDENQTTYEDLARFSVSAPAEIKTGEVKDTGLLAGIGLGRDLSSEIQTRVDDAASELGSGRFERPDLGVMPTAKGFDPSDFGMLADINDEAGRQMRLAMAAAEAGDNELYEKHKNKATKMVSYNRMVDNKGAVTESATRQFGKIITGHIADTAGFETKYTMNPDGSTSVVSSWQETSDRSRANTTGQVLTELYNTAVNTHGINYATASRIIHQAVDANRIPVLQESPDGVVTLVVGDQTLVNGGFTGGKGAYSQNQVNQSAQTPPQSSTGQTQQQQTPAQQPATPGNVGSLIAAHNSAKSSTQKNQFLRKIYGAYGGSQNVPQNILSQLK